MTWNSFRTMMLTAFLAGFGFGCTAPWLPELPLPLLITAFILLLVAGVATIMAYKQMEWIMFDVESYISDLERELEE